jgi:hypothetical protein
MIRAPINVPKTVPIPPTKLVRRRAVSGTYMTDGPSARSGLLFGLLIPNLGEAEIFGPICQGTAESAQRRNHAMLDRIAGDYSEAD